MYNIFWTTHLQETIMIQLLKTRIKMFYSNLLMELYKQE